jgi:hypothetical protein
MVIGNAVAGRQQELFAALFLFCSSSLPDSTNRLGYKPEQKAEIHLPWQLQTDFGAICADGNGMSTAAC